MSAATALATAADALRLAANALDAAATAARAADRDASAMPPGLVSITEAARTLGLSRTGLYAAMYRGEVPTKKIGRRRLVVRADLDRITERVAEGLRP